MKYIFLLTVRKLIVLYSILVIVFIYLVNLSNESLVQDMKNDVFKQLSIITNSKSERIRSWREERITDAGIMMNSSGFITTYAKWLKEPANKELEYEVDRRITSYYSYFKYKTILLVDKERKVIYSVDRRKPLLKGEALLNFNASVEKNSPVISELFLNESDNSICMDVAAPYYENGEFIGGIILRIDPNQYLYPLLSEWINSSKSAETVLLKVKNDSVVILNNLRFNEKTALNFKISLTDNSQNKIMSVRAAKGLRGVSEVYDYRGVETLIDAKQVPLSDWIIMTKIDKEEAFEEIQKIITVRWVSGFTAMGVIGFMFFWIWSNRKKEIQIEKLKDEKRRLELVKYYENLITYANVAMILSDENMNIVNVNRRALELYGFTKEEMLNMNVKDLAYSGNEDFPDGIPEIENSLLKGITYDSFQKRKDNSVFPAEISLNIIKVEGKNKYQRIINDTTIRKKAAEIIQESNRHLQELNSEKDKFFSIISHDLRGPLGNFMQLTDLISKEISGMTKEEVLSQVLLMKESSASIYRMLENILEWSLFHRGIKGNDPEFFSLPEFLIEISRVIIPVAEKKNIELKLVVPDELEIYADKSLLNGIVRNLAFNAVKYTNQGGKVKISAIRNDLGVVEISVEDNGIGMSQELKENLFNSAFKTSRKGTDGETSSGLGLLICWEFAEKMGAKLEVESRQGKGSKFTLELIKPGNAFSD